MNRIRSFHSILLLFGAFTIAFNLAVAFHELGHATAVLIDGGQIQFENEEKRLIQTSSELVKSVSTVALNTGMRLREILNLKWNQINFHARVIKVDNAKSGRIRYVDVNTPRLRELQMLRRRDGQSPYVFLIQRQESHTLTPRKDSKRHAEELASKD